MNELTESFAKYFKVAVVAPGDDESLRQALHLRYQVYCIEHPFEKPAGTDEIECDEFDAHSAHSLLLSRRNDEVVGTVRLVLPRREQPHTLFPIEQHCGKFFDKKFFDARTLPRGSTSEISRFAISKEFKKRLMDTEYPWGASNLGEQEAEHMKALERRIIPHITLGLFLAIVRMSVRHDITHWYAVMEPALLRLLKKFSIEFIPLGPVVDYHGKRQPCVAEIAAVLESMERNCPDIWALITDNGLTWPSALEAEKQAAVKQVA